MPQPSFLARCGVFVASMTPWMLSLYLHYWLEHDEVWAVDMPFRALISVALIALGMCCSFLLYRYLAGRQSG